MFILMLTSVLFVGIFIGWFVILKYHIYKQQLQKTHSISLPPEKGSNTTRTAYPGDYITVGERKEWGVSKLTQGIWLIEVADRSGDGLISLRGQQYDSDGILRRVVLNFTTSNFTAECARTDTAITPKGSEKYETTRSAFVGNDFVAKDPK
jgi:hypothetical protein